MHHTFMGNRLHVYKDLQQPRKGSIVSVPSMRQSLTGAGGAITSGIDPSARQTSKGFGLLITFDNIGSGSYAYGAGMAFASLRFSFCIRNPSTQETYTLPIPAIRERKRIFYTCSTMSFTCHVESAIQSQQEEVWCKSLRVRGGMQSILLGERCGVANPTQKCDHRLVMP